MHKHRNSIFSCVTLWSVFQNLVTIDKRVTKLVDSPENLKEVIFDAEKTQDTILDKISKVQMFIELHTHRQSEIISISTSAITVSDNRTHLQNMNSQQSESISPPQREISSLNNMETVPAAMTLQVTNPYTTLIHSKS